MKLLYISRRLPQPVRNEMLSHLKIYDGASGEVHSNSIFKGLADNHVDMQNVNVPPLGPYPQMNKELVSRNIICVEDEYEIINVGYCNLFVYQHFSIQHHLYKILKKNYSNTHFDVILIYALEKSLIQAALRYKEKYCSQSKIVVIVPDLVEDMYINKDIRTTLQRYLFGIDQTIYEKINGFIYLSELMKEKISETKPYCVVECLYDTTEKFIRPCNEGEEKIVFYSGKLHEKFGVKHLVDAFIQTTDEKMRLHLCGNGDSEGYIKEMSAKDHRIRFLGQLPRDKVLDYQSKATLLVNPRLPKGAYTRYSFPSKTIQYLASGVPALIYQLPGIPKEYYEHCFSIKSENLTLKHLASEMERICQLPHLELSQMGEEARKWVINNKNGRVQCEKMIEFLSCVV